MNIENFIKAVSECMMKYIWKIPISIHTMNSSIRVDIGDLYSMDKYYLHEGDSEEYIQEVYNNFVNKLNELV